MDYHERHGHDVSSFDLPSTHRLPTVSAAQALDEFNGDFSRQVSTGLPDLDRALTGNVSSLSTEQDEKGGIQKGQVTEIWGPPGVGKTAFGIQAAANVLRDGKSVVWVDCFYAVSHDRLTDVCRAVSGGDEVMASDRLDKLIHYACPSLSHFIALICRPTHSSLPSDVALIVIDSLSVLVNHAFPRLPAPNAAAKGNSKGPSSSVKRLQVLQYVVGALQKLAATRDAAVIVLTQCATRMQAERRATLTPAINANVWEQGIATRMALFRDWMWHDGHAFGARLAAVQKANGKVTSNATETVYAFKVEPTGLFPASYDRNKPSVAFSSTPVPKRKLNETGFEIPDSEDEDYGWQEEDTSLLPGMPPQWQGSEDVILGQLPETDDEGNIDDSELEAEKPLDEE
ncbi:DNA repair protein rhp55 [Cytospora mali]|uniref:DNA repair protein rhp55 n=1 Tax=Cytospora mali TaxID=578113 RepID=A0A194VY02_CYTMA|nr:DNA repair protein rhp55 [Valsa mali]